MKEFQEEPMITHMMKNVLMVSAGSGITLIAGLIMNANSSMNNHLTADIKIGAEVSKHYYFFMKSRNQRIFTTERKSFHLQVSPIKTEETNKKRKKESK